MGLSYRHAASSHVGESAVSGSDFAQLLRVRHGKPDDGVPVSPSEVELPATKKASDDPALAAGPLPTAGAANLAAVAVVAVVPPPPAAVESAAVVESGALSGPVTAVASYALPGSHAAVVPFAGAMPSAAMSQEFAARPLVVNAVAAVAGAPEVPTVADAAAPVASNALPGPHAAVVSVAGAMPSAAMPQELAARPLVVNAVAAVAGAPGVPTVADAAAPFASDALPGPHDAVVSVAGAMLSAAMPQDPAPRLLMGGGEVGGASVAVTPAAQEPKPLPRSAAANSVSVVAAAPELSTGSHFPGLAAPATPHLDAAGAIQSLISVAEHDRPGLPDAVADSVDGKLDVVASLPTSQAVLGVADDQPAAPLVATHPSVVQALASAVAEASVRLSGLAAANVGTQKLQLVIDNGEAGRIRMDMVFSEPGHAALVVHASSEAQSQLLGQRSQQLVDTLRGMGLVVQVSVRQDNASGGPPDGRPQSGQGQGMTAVAPTNAARRTTGAVTPVSAMTPRVSGGTRLDLYA